MSGKASKVEWVRGWLGIGIVVFGIVGVTAIAITIMCVADPKKSDETAKLLLSSVLPLLGTWVGTVLAYYFAKESMETATRTTRELAGIEEKLRSVAVTTAMIPIGQADKLQMKRNQDPEKLVLKDLIDQMVKAKRNRLPVLSETGAAMYVIHRSTLTEYVAEKALGAAAGAAPPSLTIADLKNERSDLFKKINAWACVGQAMTLAHAKQSMEAVADCSDVFVTESGRSDEPVVGWITNVEISRHAKA